MGLIYFNGVCARVYVRVCMCVCVRHVCIWACLLIFRACGGQRLMMGIFLCCLLVLFVLSQKLSLNLELTVLARLVGQRTPELACSHLYPALGLQLCTPMPSFSMGAGDLNPGPCAYAASTSPSESSLHPSVCDFRDIPLK